MRGGFGFSGGLGRFCGADCFIIDGLGELVGCDSRSDRRFGRLGVFTLFPWVSSGFCRVLVRFCGLRLRLIVIGELIRFEGNQYVKRCLRLLGVGLFSIGALFGNWLYLTRFAFVCKFRRGLDFS